MREHASPSQGFEGAPAIIDKTVNQVQKLTSAYARLSNAVRSVKSDTKQFGTELKGIATGIDTLKAKMDKAAASSSNFAKNNLRNLASIFSAGVVTRKAQQLIDLAGDITDAAGATGIGVEAFQQFSAAGKDAGLTADDLQTAFKELKKSQVEALAGNDASIKRFQRLGISMQDLEKMLPEELFRRVAGGFERIGQSALADHDALQLLGRSGDRFAHSFRNGFLDAAKSAKEMGQVLSEDVIDELDRAGDEIDRMGKRLIVNLANPLVTAINYLEIFADSMNANILYVETFWNVFKQGGNVLTGGFAEAVRAAQGAVDEYFKSSTVGSREPNAMKGPKPTTTNDVESDKKGSFRDQPRHLTHLQEIGARVQTSALAIIPQRQLSEAKRTNGLLERLNKTQEGIARYQQKYGTTPPSLVE